jgi:hypothetical protein
MRLPVLACAAASAATAAALALAIPTASATTAASQASAAPAATRFGDFNVGPEPAHAGQTLTVKGTLQHQVGKAWKAYARQRVEIYCRNTWHQYKFPVGRVTTDAAGRFKLKTKTDMDCLWRARFVATPTHLGSVSREDIVHVTHGKDTFFPDFRISPKTVVKGAKATTRGRLVYWRGSAHVPLKHYKVQIWEHLTLPGNRYSRPYYFGTVRTDSKGYFKLVVRPKATGEFYAVFKGGNSLRGAGSGWALITVR